MAMKYTLPKNAQELDVMVKKAIRSANNMRAMVQMAAIAILHHAYEHGDYTAANTLVNGLGAGTQGKALVKWFVTFGGLVVDEPAKGEASKGFIGWKGKAHIKEQFQNAKAIMWHDTIKTEKPFEGYNLADNLRAVLTKHNNMMKRVEKLSAEDRAKVNTAIVDEGLLKQLWAMIDFGPILNDVIEAEVIEPATEQDKAA